MNPLSGEPDGYEFTGPTRFDRLFTGIAVTRPVGIDHAPIGCEDITAENTFDGDYGRMLEAAAARAATRKGWRARRDLNPRPTGSKPGALSN